MKAFNLKEYLENPSRKVVTREGRNVRIRCTDRKGEGQPIVALVESMNKDTEIVRTYGEDGKWSPSGKDSNVDLFFAPEKQVGWVNVWELENHQRCGSFIYSSEEEAKMHGKGSLATIKVEWEE